MGPAQGVGIGQFWDAVGVGAEELENAVDDRLFEAEVR